MAIDSVVMMIRQIIQKRLLLSHHATIYLRVVVLQRRVFLGDELLRMHPGIGCLDVTLVGAVLQILQRPRGIIWINRLVLLLFKEVLDEGNLLLAPPDLRRPLLYHILIILFHTLAKLLPYGFSNTLTGADHVGGGSPHAIRNLLSFPPRNAHANDDHDDNDDDENGAADHNILIRNRRIIDRDDCLLQPWTV